MRRRGGVGGWRAGRGFPGVRAKEARRRSKGCACYLWLLAGREGRSDRAQVSGRPKHPPRQAHGATALAAAATVLVDTRGRPPPACAARSALLSSGGQSSPSYPHGASCARTWPRAALRARHRHRGVLTPPPSPHPAIAASPQGGGWNEAGWGNMECLDLAGVTSARQAWRPRMHRREASAACGPVIQQCPLVSCVVRSDDDPVRLTDPQHSFQWKRPQDSDGFFVEQYGTAGGHTTGRPPAVAGGCAALPDGHNDLLCEGLPSSFPAAVRWRMLQRCEGRGTGARAA